MICIAGGLVDVTKGMAFATLVGLVGLISPAARGAITLTGDVVPSPVAGDPWNVNGQLSVGDTVVGTMSVDGGSDVSNTDGYVGNNVGSQGTVTVTGSDSRW